MKNDQRNIDLPDTSFLLDKWYMDLITNEGEVFILYAATLTWKKFSVHYNSILQRKTDSSTSLDWWVRGVKFPEYYGKTLSLEIPSKQIEGTWTPEAKPIQERLVDTDDGILDWNCIMPSAQVKLSYKGKTYTGNGYAENLKMTILPWKIGMKTLRWGRFNINSDSVVWIQVDPLKQWCWFNGEIQPTATITDDTISLSELNRKISMNKIQELESEHKIFNVLKHIGHYVPGFRSMIPVSDLMANEVKWLSEGIQYQEECEDGNALLIHERVTFG